MSKTKIQPKNLYYLLIGIFIAMVSVAEASASAVGEWKLKEVWRENEAEPLSITRDGNSYVMKILEKESSENLKTLSLSIKVGNVMRSSIEILEEGESSDEQQKIKIGFVMSTRMFPGSEEKEQLEGYLSDRLPKMVSMKVGDGEELVLSSEDGARIVCEPSNASED